MQELLLTLIQAIVTVATPIVAVFAIQFLKAKAEHAKTQTQNATVERYITEITDAVTTAVLHTSQTYTDTLKKSGTFSTDNQREAFGLAVTQAKTLLAEDTSRFIESAYGDVSKYLAARVEAEVKLLK